MKIFIGADHRGFKLKSKIIEFLQLLGYEAVDLGSYKEDVPCDYPKFSYQVARAVARSKKNKGILVCMTGIGNSITANKVPGAYAALCYTPQAARLARQHNNSNILVLGAKFVNKKDLYKIITIWLKSKFKGGRHLRRFKQIKAIEKKATRD